MQKLNLKPAHKPVGAYYKALEQFRSLKVSHETAVRDAFQYLLKSCCSQFGWTLVPEWTIKRKQRHAARVDGAIVDEFRLTHGFWEAKDEADDLRSEIKKKFAGHPTASAQKASSRSSLTTVLLITSLSMGCEGISKRTSTPST